MYTVTRRGQRIASSPSVITASIPSFQRRAVSQRSSINRGLRSEVLANSSRRQGLDNQNSTWRDTAPGSLRGTTSRDDKARERRSFSPRSRHETDSRDSGSDLGFSPRELQPRHTSQISKREGDEHATEFTPNAGRILKVSSSNSDSRYPLSVPHTTAASEFLYGQGAVYAALKAGRRKMYTLYIGERGNSRDEAQTWQMRQMAQRIGVKIKEGNRVDIRLLDKMSDGRPHNVRDKLERCSYFANIM